VLGQFSTHCIPLRLFAVPEFSFFPFSSLRIHAGHIFRRALDWKIEKHAFATLDRELEFSSVRMLQTSL